MMASKIHALLEPENPTLAERRSIIAAALVGTYWKKCEFKYMGRWFKVTLFPHCGLDFRYRSNNKPVGDLEQELIFFLSDTAV